MNHRTSNVAYSTSTPSGSCASVSETRTCMNAVLSGSYTATSCSSGCTAKTISNCTVGARIHGAASGSCVSGYTGSCSYLCNNGSDSVQSNSCVVAGGHWALTANGCADAVSSGGYTTSCGGNVTGAACSTIGSKCNWASGASGACPPFPGPFFYLFTCQ